MGGITTRSLPWYWSWDRGILSALEQQGPPTWVVRVNNRIFALVLWLHSYNNVITVSSITYHALDDTVNGKLDKTVIEYAGTIEKLFFQSSPHRSSRALMLVIKVQRWETIIHVLFRVRFMSLRSLYKTKQWRVCHYIASNVDYVLRLWLQFKVDSQPQILYVPLGIKHEGG